MSLGDSLMYAPKPFAVSSLKARWNQPAYNKFSFNPGEVIMLIIPTGHGGSYLNARMSYLKFRLTNTGTDKAHPFLPILILHHYSLDSSCITDRTFLSRFTSTARSSTYGMT